MLNTCYKTNFTEKFLTETIDISAFYCQDWRDKIFIVSYLMLRRFYEKIYYFIIINDARESCIFS